jgi:hypothetical protein
MPDVATLILIADDAEEQDHRAVGVRGTVIEDRTGIDRVGGDEAAVRHRSASTHGGDESDLVTIGETGSERRIGEVDRDSRLCREGLPGTAALTKMADQIRDGSAYRQNDRHFICSRDLAVRRKE